MPAEEDVEDEVKDKDAEKDCYESGSDSDDGDQEDDKVIDDRAEHDGHGKWVVTDIPHANMVQQEERETEVGDTRNEGGDSDQRNGDDDSKGDGPEHDKPKSDESEQNMAEGDVFEDHDCRKGKHTFIDKLLSSGT